MLDSRLRGCRLALSASSYVLQGVGTGSAYVKHPQIVCVYCISLSICLSKSLEPKDQWPWDLVCNIGDVGPTRFEQMMNIG